MIPAALRICADCGALATGEACAVCAHLAELYDARYHARRTAAFFAALPREQPPIDDHGLGVMRGAATAIRWVVLPAAVIVVVFLLGAIFGRFFG